MKVVVRRHVRHAKDYDIDISSIADDPANIGLTGSDKGQWEEENCHLNRKMSHTLNVKGVYLLLTSVRSFILCPC